jgi:hypothetical protein
MRTIYLVMGENNKVEGWGSTRGNDADVEFQIEEDSPFLNDLPFAYELKDGLLVKSDLILLETEKELKDYELNRECEKAILGGFKHTIDGVEYHFSYDMQAQTNFGDTRALMTEGLITEMPWTAKRDGDYVRINITKDIMNGITLAIMNHKANHISKYRDSLLPLVEKAETIEEVRAITWDSVPLVDSINI